MKEKIVKGLLLIVAFFGFGNVYSQMVVNNSLTVTELVTDVLVGEFIEVSNVTFNGLPGDQVVVQAGSFDATNSNIPIGNGVILTTGPIDIAVGPNDDEGAGSSIGGSYQDPDLNAIASSSTNDAAVLEFDFVPLGETLVFNYVFASEEYNEYVCSSFNDAFGFFLSGPGISGSFENNGINIAQIPGAGLPVTINNVNNGTIGTFGSASNCSEAQLSNSEFFIDNENNTEFSSTQYDGFTVSLEAIAQVQCGETYHIKLTISDVADGALDSGVFLEAGSFGAIPIVDVNIDIPFEDPIVGEGCSINYVFTREVTNIPETVDLVISGSAEEGVDFTPFPDSIHFDVGQNSLTLNIEAILDGVDEGLENIILDMFFTTCIDTILITDTLFIANTDSMRTVLGGPDKICNEFGESTNLNAEVTGGFGDIIYEWVFQGSDTPADINNALDPNPLVIPPFESFYELKLTDACGQKFRSTDAYFVENVCPIQPPNIITPNNDGSNDVFVIKSLDLFPGSSLTIYDRWGKEVFKTDNYLNDWGAEGLDDGTYFWVIVLSKPSETSKVNGYITVVR